MLFKSPIDIILVNAKSIKININTTKSCYSHFNLTVFKTKKIESRTLCSNFYGFNS